MKKKRLFFLRGAALLALALVLALDIAFLFKRDRAFSPLENQNLQQRPALSLSELTSGRYETRFDSFLADQFPFRDQWITLKSTLDRLAGRTRSNGVYLGRDGWLIQDFTPPSEADYAATRDALLGFIGRHGDVTARVMIAPTALTVYADRLPALATAGDEGGYLDRLAADLGGAAQFIDLRPAFMAAKETTQLYYRTDHHWTSDGAYLAYLELSRAAGLSGEAARFERRLLSSDFRGTLSAASGFRMGEADDLCAWLPAQDGVQYTVTYVSEGERSASLFRAEHLDTRDQYAVFLDGNHAQIRIETTAQGGRALLVLKDSYANCFIPLLVQDYRKIVVVDPRYYTGDLDVLAEAEGVNELLVLYNAETFASDTSLRGDMDKA